MTSPLLRRILVPVAHEDDATQTCEALEPYLEEGTELHFVHVIQKAGGAPDKAPVEARREAAEASFDAARACLADSSRVVETEIRYDTDVVGGIVEAAVEADATLIAFLPRSGSRLARLLSGDLTRRLVDTDRLPVLVLPDPDETA